MSLTSQLSREETSIKAQLMEIMRETTAMTGGDETFADAPQSVAAPKANPNPVHAAPTTNAPFTPLEPESLAAAGLNESEVEGLILKCMLSSGNITGRQLSEQLCLSFKILQSLLAQLKIHRLVSYKSDAGLNDYVYELTDHGTDRARRHAQHCTYYGAAPVAFDELVLSDEMFS